MNAHQRRKALRAKANNAKPFKLYPHQVKVLESIKKMGKRIETFVPASQSLSRLVRHFQENPLPPMIVMPKPEIRHSDIGAADMIIAISASQEPLPAAPIIMHTLKPRRIDIRSDIHFGGIGLNIIDEVHLPKGAGKALLAGDFVDGSAVQIVDLPVPKDET